MFLQCYTLDSIVSRTSLGGRSLGGQSPDGRCDVGRKHGGFNLRGQPLAPRSSYCPSAGNIVPPIPPQGTLPANIEVLAEGCGIGHVDVRIHVESDGRSLLVTEGTSWRVL